MDVSPDLAPAPALEAHRLASLNHPRWSRFALSAAAGSVLGANAVLFVVYLALIILLPPGGFYVGDQGVKYVQVVALAQTHSPIFGRIDDVLSIFRPAFTGGLYQQVGSTYEATFSVAYAALVVLFYLLFGLRGLVLPSAIGAALAAYASGQIGTQLRVRHPWVIVFLVGLASPLVFYALVLWEHGLAISIATFATFLTLRRRYFAAGLLLALAAWFREEAYVLVPTLIIATIVAFGWRVGLRLIRGLIPGVLVGLIPWYFYNLRAVGTPAGLHGSQPTTLPVSHVQSLLVSRLLSVENNLVPLDAKKTLALLAIVVICAIGLRLWRRPIGASLVLFWFGLAALGLAKLAGDVVQLSRDSGYVPLFAGGSFTDVFLVAFAALATLPALWQRRTAVVYLWLVLTGYVLAVVAAAPYTSGGGWGPRYLIGVYPFVAILVVLGFEAVHGPSRTPRGPDAPGLYHRGASPGSALRGGGGESMGRPRTGAD